MRADHFGDVVLISVPRFGHSVVAPTALRRKSNNRNVSGLDRRGLLVFGVWAGAAISTLKQTVAFSIVNLLGHETATDAAAV